MQALREAHAWDVRLPMPVLRGELLMADPEPQIDDILVEMLEECDA